MAKWNKHLLTYGFFRFCQQITPTDILLIKKNKSRMKRIISMMLLCATVVLASCSKDDSKTIDVAGVTLDKTTASIVIGTTQTLVATVAPDNVEDKRVTWTSSDATVATVAEGVVTPVTEGTATITATSVADNTKTATCLVTVTKAVVAVAFNGLTANGSATETTTTLTLTFDIAIEGLAAADITLTDAATTGTTKGELTNKDNGVYELAVSDIEKGGEITVAVAKEGYAITPASNKVTVNYGANYIEVDGIKVAIGNLIADGANGCKIGVATDAGLFFPFGSLVGWSGGATGDGVGAPNNGLKLAINVMPNGYTGFTEWNKNWKGDLATEDAVTGKGDPCKYYLKDTWRLPTRAEYQILFNNTTTGWDGAPGWSWVASPASATHKGGLVFPASGSRSKENGVLSKIGSQGNYWAVDPTLTGNYGAYIYFYDTGLYAGSSNNMAGGLSVRCVKGSANK